MAEIHISDVLKNYESDFREPLKEAVKETIKGAEFDEHKLYEKFRERIKVHLGSRFEVNDKYVDGGK